MHIGLRIDPAGRRRRWAAAPLLALLLLPQGALAQPQARNREAQLSTEYRRVLARLGDGDRDGALEALVALETRLAGADTAEEIEWLWRAKLRVIRDLLPAQVEVLVPILLLHHDAFTRYRFERKSVLALHSRIMTEELADFYSKKAATEGARVVASRVVASLGGHLQQALALGASTAAFEAALALDARNDAARLGLAATQEKTGHYPEAAAQLRQLLESNPRHPEAQLRLAINYLRTGEETRGQAMLEKLMLGEAPAWVAVLAFEELARLQASRHKTREAVTILRAGTQRFPDNQRLLLLLAFQQDRLLDVSGSLESARRAAAAQETGNTPRLRYNEWPRDDLEEGRRLIAESAQPRQRLLAEALRMTSGVAG